MSEYKYPSIIDAEIHAQDDKGLIMNIPDVAAAFAKVEDMRRQLESVTSTRETRASELAQIAVDVENAKTLILLGEKPVVSLEDLQKREAAITKAMIADGGDERVKRNALGILEERAEATYIAAVDQQLRTLLGSLPASITKMRKLSAQLHECMMGIATTTSRMNSECYKPILRFPPGHPFQWIARMHDTEFRWKDSTRFFALMERFDSHVSGYIDLFERGIIPGETVDDDPEPVSSDEKTEIPSGRGSVIIDGKRGDLDVNNA